MFTYMACVMLAPKNLKYESCMTRKEIERDVAKVESLYSLLALLHHTSN